MVAIVIPYFKITYFAETLESLANQTNKNFNVYVGNDASPNNPDSVIKKYSHRFNLIYKKFEDNLGGRSLTSQWNRCIEMIDNEEWIMILGDDDYISNDYFEKFYENIEEIDTLNIKVVRFATRVIRQTTGEISKLYTHPKIENSTDFFFRKFFKYSRGSLSEQIFKKDSYLKHGFRDFPLGWGADNFAWLDFTEFGDMFTINDATAYFRISEENISRDGYKEDVKYEAKYRYFTIIIYNYLDRFNKFQRWELLKFYERVVYKAQKISFKFWIYMSFFIFKEKSGWEVVKFTRRILINLVRRWIY